MNMEPTKNQRLFRGHSFAFVFAGSQVSFAGEQGVPLSIPKHAGDGAGLFFEWLAKGQDSSIAKSQANAHAW